VRSARLPAPCCRCCSRRPKRRPRWRSCSPAKADYDTVLMPDFVDKLTRHKKVRLYGEIASEFASFDPGACHVPMERKSGDALSGKPSSTSITTPPRQTKSSVWSSSPRRAWWPRTKVIGNTGERWPRTRGSIDTRRFAATDHRHSGTPDTEVAPKFGLPLRLCGMRVGSTLAPHTLSLRSSTPYAMSRSGRCCDRSSVCSTRPAADRGESRRPQLPTGRSSHRLSGSTKSDLHHRSNACLTLGKLSRRPLDA